MIEGVEVDPLEARDRDPVGVDLSLAVEAGREAVDVIADGRVRQAQVPQVVVRSRHDGRVVVNPVGRQRWIVVRALARVGAGGPDVGGLDASLNRIRVRDGCEGIVGHAVGGGRLDVDRPCAEEGHGQLDLIDRPHPGHVPDHLQVKLGGRGHPGLGNQVVLGTFDEKLEGRVGLSRAYPVPAEQNGHHNQENLHSLFLRQKPSLISSSIRCGSPSPLVLRDRDSVPLRLLSTTVPTLYSCPSIAIGALSASDKVQGKLGSRTARCPEKGGFLGRRGCKEKLTPQKAGSLFADTDHPLCRRIPYFLSRLCRVGQRG